MEDAARAAIQTGDTAVPRAMDERLATTFTDYPTLIEVDGRWQIAMKVFFDHADEPRT